MGTTIECTSCHAKFAGKEEYAGRRIRCPKCQNVFRVPAADVPALATAAVAKVVASEAAPPAPVVHAALVDASPAASTNAVGSATPKNKYAGVEIDEWNVPDDFEYSVTQEVDPNATRCPFCHSAMRIEDVLCLGCGYNRKLGQKLSTKHTADVDAEEEEKVRATSISFGAFAIPMKALWIGAGIASVMALLLYLVVPVLLLVIVGFSGLALVAIGHIALVVVAFQEDILHGLLVLFVPLYRYVFVFTHWHAAQIPFFVWLAGVVLLVFAAMLAFSLAPADAESAALFLSCALRPA